MVCVMYVNHCKPRKIRAAKETRYAVVKNDRRYSCQAAILMTRSYFPRKRDENSSGVKMDANPLIVYKVELVKPVLFSIFLGVGRK